MIRHIIWDVDGTLFDTYPVFVEAYRLALDDLGARAKRSHIEVLCRASLRGCGETLAAELDLSVEGLLAGFTQYCAAMPARVQPPFNGVEEVCAAIRAAGGLNLIATQRTRESLKGLLGAHGMLDTFVDGVTAEDGYPHKPDPAMFEALIARHGLARDEVLAVGDRDVDILAGRAAGVRVCLYGPALPGIAADCQVTDYADLLVWLGEEVAVDSPNPKGCIR